MEITQEMIKNFELQLISEEKSTATLRKYIHDVECFYSYLESRPLTKVEVMDYKRYLMENYAPASVNSMLIPLNRFLSSIGCYDCTVKTLKVQQRIFASEDKELNRTDLRRLLKAANSNRTGYIIQTMCGTGIRVSELEYITVEAVMEGRAIVNNKGKTRTIFIPTNVQRLLLEYIRDTHIKSGCVFVTKSGKPIHRTAVWKDMQRLCKKAKVNPEKVFPHNLRHLFARTYYAVDKDIVHLADLLGHSSINTTRIYTAKSRKEHMKSLQKMEKALLNLDKKN